MADTKILCTLELILSGLKAMLMGLVYGSDEGRMG